MNIRVFVAGALVLAVLAPAANALTIIDKDKTSYTVKVTPKNGTEANVAVKADSKADVDCKAGCQLSLNGKTQDVAGTLTKIVIRDGKFEM